MNNGDVIAFNSELYLRTEIQGGRRTPIKSGFRTDLKFFNDSRIAIFEFDKEWFFPGEKHEVVCSVLLKNYDEAESLLKFGSTIIFDGDFTIGEVFFISIK